MQKPIIWAAVALLSLVTAPARADDAPEVKIDRAASLKIAPQFQPQVEAALSLPVHDLYVKALAGGANDTWAYGLAMYARRDNIVDVPPVQLKIFAGYSHRVDLARAAYEKAHPDADTSTMSMDQFVKPTDDEVNAVTIVNAINNAPDWLDRAAKIRNDKGDPVIDPAAMAQSQACLKAVNDKLDADDMMSQLMGSIAVTSGSADKTGKADTAKIMSELSEAQPDDAELDTDSLCGGPEPFKHYAALAKVFYRSDITISVSNDKDKKPQ